MLGNPIANIIILLELHLIHIKSHEIPLNHYEIPWKPLYNPIINPWNPYQILIFHGILPSSHGSLRFHPPRLCHLFPHQLRRPRGSVIRGLGVGGAVRGGAEPRATRKSRNGMEVWDNSDAYTFFNLHLQGIVLPWLISYIAIYI